MNSKMNVAILSLLMCIATGGSISFAQYPFHVDSSRYLMLYNTAWSSAGGPAEQLRFDGSPTGAARRRLE
mgnify:CR=1 FL=1